MFVFFFDSMYVCHKMIHEGGGMFATNNTKPIGGWHRIEPLKGPGFGCPVRI